MNPRILFCYLLIAGVLVSSSTFLNNATKWVIHDCSEFPGGYQVGPHNFTERRLPRHYANASQDKGPDYVSYANFTWEWKDMSVYTLGEWLGRGGFGEVFKAYRDDRLYVLKMLKTNKTMTIKRELKVYSVMKENPFALQIMDMVISPENETLYGYTMPYLKMMDYKDQYAAFKDYDVKYVMYQILKGLDYAHSIGVMHRDIKPVNIAIDPDTKRVTIIDWGLADFFLPNKTYGPKSGTLRYKAPEQLLNYTFITYATDIWAVGCTFAAMIFDRFPFYTGQETYHQFRKINRHLGTVGLLEMMEKHNISWPFKNKTLNYHDPMSYDDFINEKNQHKATSVAVDLLSKMLVWDFHERIMAHEAMEHPYFDAVRHLFDDFRPLTPESLVYIASPPPKNSHKDKNLGTEQDISDATHPDVNPSQAVDDNHPKANANAPDSIPVINVKPEKKTKNETVKNEVGKNEADKNETEKVEADKPKEKVVKDKKDFLGGTHSVA